MERFSLISIQIRGLSPDVALTLMIMGLKSRPFLGNLCKKKITRNTREIKGRVARFIHMEEMTMFREQMRGES